MRWNFYLKGVWKNKQWINKRKRGFFGLEGSVNICLGKNSLHSWKIHDCEFLILTSYWFFLQVVDWDEIHIGKQVLYSIKYNLKYYFDIKLHTTNV